MTKDGRIREIMEFVKYNFDCIEDYTKGLNKVGMKEHLRLFGIDINSTCKLESENIRTILNIVLKDWE